MGFLRPHSRRRAEPWIKDEFSPKFLIIHTVATFMYSEFLGLINEPKEEHEEILRTREKLFKNPEYGQEYDVVRFGLPNGTIEHDKFSKQIDILTRHYLHHGYETWPYSRLSPSFRSHVAKFRASLDFWEQFSNDRIMDKTEIYFRCLREGPSFTEKIKKIRSTCYRAYTTETDTDIEEEYYSPHYKGYNSLIHERYLIHWDDTKEIDDVKYAFIETGPSRKKEFRRLLDEFWNDFRLDEIDFNLDFDMIGSLKNTKMFDPVTKKTSLMRDFWNSDINPDVPYYAKRVVVPTTPGSTRDTGVGDPSTILKVKQLNSLARSISEVVPYSANTTAKSANGRLKRVLKKNSFLHLDFKKFGLTFPRELMNELIRKIGESGNIDVNHLIINDFFVEIDGMTFKTHRGTMLGWLDSINSICVSIILHGLAKDLKFDFVTFNDDVEISKFAKSNIPQTLELLRMAVLSTINFFDIPISLNKTFGSQASVFLERYAYYDKYKIDMYKEQLTVDAYAKSCVTTQAWQAKFFFSAAEQWTKSEYAKERCISTLPYEFRADEIHMPLWSGGWYIQRKNGQDLSLVNSDKLGLRMGILLSRISLPRYSTKPVKVSRNIDIQNKINKSCHGAYDPSLQLVLKGWSIDHIRDINHEIDYIYGAVQTLSHTYEGSNESYPQIVLNIVDKLRSGILDFG